LSVPLFPRNARGVFFRFGYCDPALPDELNVAIGFFDNPEGFRPAAHAYWGLRLPWVEFADNLPHVDGYSRVRDAAIGDPRDRQKAR
jgi:hypothetical protein